MLYRLLLRPIIFSLTRHDPEEAHAAILQLLATVSRMPLALAMLRHTWSGAAHDPALACTVAGLRFPNPLGLAAGYDKDGIALPALAALGFGFIETGTVTWHAQPGNPRPRIFRLAAASGIINRMGFNNAGAIAMANNLAQTPPLAIPIGISLGKSRRTPLDNAIADYCASLRTLYPHGDFFTINISSPNTPGLRTLQERDHLDGLLAAMRQEQQQLSIKTKTMTTPHHATPLGKPLFVKIAPDLTNEAILDVLDLCHIHQVSGIIATNTTRVGEGTALSCCETGGMSGRPLAARALEVVRFIARETHGTLPIIGVGGIFGADDASRMLDAGASLLQVYTGLIYEGPGVVQRVLAGVRAAL
jgi:dihydroorotate dehydrogenase